MKRNLTLIALAALILPALLRGLWFYRGIPERTAFATPDYQSFNAPEAPLNPNSPDAEDIQQIGGVVLFDAVHFNQFTMTEIESLTGAVKERGGRVELLDDTTLLEYKLKYANAFVSVSPSLLFTTDEIRILTNFVERGGRLLVFTDATRNSIYFDYVSGNPIAYGDANAANSLLAPFDISVNSDYLYNLDKNEGNFRNVFFDEFAKNELTFGLKEVVFYGTHSVESPSGLVLLRGAESSLSSANDAHDPTQGGAALSQDGNILAFGDFTFMSPPYNNHADNASLIVNLADFLLSGSQKITFGNYPFLFRDGALQVYLAPEVTKTAEVIAALGRLQASFKFMNIQAEFTDKAPRDGGALIIGSFASNEETAPYLKKFGITLEEGSEFIGVPGFGEIGIYGNGILLLDTADKGNKLILLANSMEDTVYLLDTLGSGYLYNCLLQDHTAVCSVGSGGSYNEGTNTEETQDSTGEGTAPQTEETPTPQG